MSEHGNTGRKHSDETRAKMRAAWERKRARGYVYLHSDESKAKMREGHRRNREGL